MITENIKKKSLSYIVFFEKNTNLLYLKKTRIWFEQKYLESRFFFFNFNCLIVFLSA